MNQKVVLSSRSYVVHLLAATFNGSNNKGLRGRQLAKPLVSPFSQTRISFLFASMAVTVPIQKLFYTKEDSNRVIRPWTKTDIQ